MAKPTLADLKKSLQKIQLGEQIKKTLSLNTQLKPKADVSLALNIGNYHLKGLILRGDQVFDYFLEPNQDLAKTLGKVLSQKKISPRSVRLSVKNSKCLVRYFSFPKMEKKKLEQALSYELNKHIPFSPEEVYFDYYVLKDASPSELSILLAVAKKDFIDNILEVFKGFGLSVSEINLDSVCLLNMFLDSCPDSKDINACILDIGNSFSVMTIVNKGIPFLTRDVKFSTKDIVAIAARSKGIKPSEVESKLAASKDSSDFLEFVQSSISGLCKEVKSSFDYFEVNKGEHLDKIYLTGGLASVNNIETIFTEALGVDVAILPALPNSLKEADTRFLDDKFNSLRSSFSAVFGLIL